MEKIIVAVGSLRRPKLNAVWEALSIFGPALDPHVLFEVTGVEVPSGVGHTPVSREELMRGARQRAEALVPIARERGESWRYFVGLEGGLDVVPEEGRRRVFLESWAYASDGARGYFGRSGGIEVPEALAEEVLVHGVELSAAIERFVLAMSASRSAVSADAERYAREMNADRFGAAGIRDAQGAWGVLSANLITRQDAFRVAVMSAFAPFYNAKMYRTPPAAG
ncbi:MAG: DUF84 family protein [Acidobacteriia bacterium]|nr:DUF84 family protein [Terriglobia bacterium]